MIAQEMNRVLAEAFKNLSKEEQAFFRRVLEIEHEYRDMTRPRGVMDDLRKTLERVVQT